MAVRKPKPNTTALSILFPDNTLAVSEQEVKKVVRSASFDDIHTTYTKLATMFNLVDVEMRNELIKRLGRRKNKAVETEVGFLSLRERSKYNFDIEKIEKFFESKPDEDISDLFKVDYLVVTKNQKVLQQLIDKGYIVESKKVDTTVFAKLLEKYSTLRKFVTQQITQYITGL